MGIENWVLNIGQIRFLSGATNLLHQFCRWAESDLRLPWCAGPSDVVHLHGDSDQEVRFIQIKMRSTLQVCELGIVPKAFDFFLKQANRAMEAEAIFGAGDDVNFPA